MDSAACQSRGKNFTPDFGDVRAGVIVRDLYAMHKVDCKGHKNLMGIFVIRIDSQRSTENFTE